MFKTLSTLCVAAALLRVAVFAQAGGQIQGVCRDPEKAAIPGVSITLRHGGTGTERVLQTDARGRDSTFSIV
jgi:hypothetical protein